MRTAKSQRGHAAFWAGVLVLFCASGELSLTPAQFDGFGQNKIAYDRFQWKIYASPHFDIHYYGADEISLEDVVSYAESAYLRISRDLDHELRFRVPLIIYRTHAEFEQTNVDLGEVGENVGAFAEPVQNRMVLPIDQPPDKLAALIAHELTHIFQFSIFFEGYLGRALRANAPAWFMEGMASYLAKDEDTLDTMALRDAVVNNVLPSIQELGDATFLAYRYGHGIFDFIEQEHGKEGFRNFIYEYRKVLLTGSVEKAIKEAFGYDVDEFNRRFNRYLRRKFVPVLLEKKAPEDYGKEIGIKKRGVFTFAPALSPSGELVAVLGSPTRLELDLLVLSAEDGSKVRNVTKGWTNAYQHLVAEAFQGRRDLSWSPSGDLLAVFARRENARPLFLFDALKGTLEKRIDLEGIAAAASPCFSPDGRRVAFEGNRDGIVDILEVDLENGEIRNLTQDDFFDGNPWYAPDGKSLLYNRRIGAAWKVFSVDLTDPSRKTQLTFGNSLDIQPAYSRDQKSVYYASDRGGYGVFNIHVLNLASGEIRQITDVVGGCFSPVEMAERDGEPYLVFAAFFEGTFRLFRMPVRQSDATVASAESAGGPTDAEPYEPPLRLTLDADKMRPYKVRWDIDRPSFSVGVTNDGTFLANAAVQFSDLLGDQRFQILAYSVSTFSNFATTYYNLRRRTRWGASLFDYRDFYVQYNSGFGEQDQIQRTTGVTFFLERPLNRYYRVDGTVGYLDRSQDYLIGTDTSLGFPQPLFATITDRFITFEASLVGDTTRYQSFGPLHGKRFTVGAFYGLNVGGDAYGNIQEYRLDFRGYRQLTRRSLLAFRLAGVYGAGERETYYSLGGINQLRGYDFREFFGSRMFWTNLELRYPLVDVLQFPFLGIRSIRGFLFADLGAAWFQNGSFYDPELLAGAVRSNPGFGFWDSQNDRLQDARGSYGFGFQFFFLGGLQFNWSWANRASYTRFVCDPTDPLCRNLVPVEGDQGGRRMDFYIVFDY